MNQTHSWRRPHIICTYWRCLLLNMNTPSSASPRIVTSRARPKKYKRLRLHALSVAPASFSSTYEIESALSDTEWINCLTAPGRQTFICAATPIQPDPSTLNPLEKNHMDWLTDPPRLSVGRYIVLGQGWLWCRRLSDREFYFYFYFYFLASMGFSGIRERIMSKYCCDR